MVPNSTLFHHLIFITTLAILLHTIPPCFSQNDTNCTNTFHCGNIPGIGYPFWGGSRPRTCGHPDLHLSCQAGVAFLNMSTIPYRILDIHNSNRTLQIARADLWSDLCPNPLINTTFNSTVFDYYMPANDRTITLYYGCPVDLANPSNQTVRNLNGTANRSFSNSSRLQNGASNCRYNISVRVNQWDAQSLANLPNTSRSILQRALMRGFSVQWQADDDRCSNCQNSGGVCRYGGDSFVCHCGVQPSNGTCNSPSSQTEGHKAGNGHSNLRKKIIIGVTVGVGITALLFIIVYITKWHEVHEKDHESSKNFENFLNKESLAPKRYSYREIKKITKSFRDTLGQGGYGIVYKGWFPDSQAVAVKVLNETNGSGEEFINEVASISRTAHVNIVKLLGFCYNGKRRALVYEYMPNHSLDKFINGSEQSNLDWEKLYNIAVGAARGLEYLHRGCNTRIVHFDIKPHNILLDEDFAPKISDFGLAKLFKKKQSNISGLGTRGTIGYIAPEVFSRNFGAVSHKSDVYSYGMVLLEMSGARRMDETEGVTSSEVYFLDKIYKHVVVNNNQLDELLNEENEERARKILLVGIWCIQTAPADRPSMTNVLEMLEGTLESIQIPPKPVLSVPTLPVPPFSSTLSTDADTVTEN